MDKKFLALIVVLVIVVGLIIPLALAAKNSRRNPFRARPKACSDNIDNDGDTYIDWPADPGCSSKNDKSELNSGIECDDGSDNDGDGDTDYPDDGGCSSPSDDDETDCGDGICEGGEVCDVCVADCGYCNSCDDTDGGIVVTVKGTVSGYLNGYPYSYDDWCVANETHTLIEFYCDGDYCDTWMFDCSLNFTTCYDGACI